MIFIAEAPFFVLKPEQKSALFQLKIAEMEVFSVSVEAVSVLGQPRFLKIQLPKYQ